MNWYWCPCKCIL